ncbi:hypothetical protein ABEB36_014251 [Hypothenemus hampei]|uniref:MADF domain-containing protein n=1 Tax=Hypothenemus hampei TaxID=57062 RepID=A0ABD1E454_HYPHA
MDDEKFIQIIQNYPYLYDRKRVDFKDLKKNNLWREISKELNYPVSDVQNRWKYLREKYGRERKPKLPSGSGTTVYDKPEWEFLRTLS